MLRAIFYLLSRIILLVIFLPISWVCLAYRKLCKARGNGMTAPPKKHAQTETDCAVICLNEADYPRYDPMPNSWASPVAVLVPGGTKYEVLSARETGMGGPDVCSVRINGNIFLDGLGAYAVFSENGRYFCSALLKEEGYSFLILDTREKLIYRYASKHADPYLPDELAVFENGLIKAVMREGQAYPAAALRLEWILNNIVPEKMHFFNGLWLRGGSWQKTSEQAIVTFEAPPGHSVQGHLHIPQQLAHEQNPMEFFYLPKYHIVIDNIDTNCLMCGFRNPVWGNGDRMAAFEGEFAASGRKERGYCIWEQGHVTRLSPPDNKKLPPYLDYSFETPIAGIEHGKILITCLFKTAALDERYFKGFEMFREYYWNYSDKIRLRDSNNNVLSEFVTEKAMCSAGISTFDGTFTEFTSSALQDKSRIVFTPLPGEDSYACRAGLNEFDGKWVLEHRVSFDGRFVVLLTAEEHARAFVYDSRNKTLRQCPMTGDVRHICFLYGNIVGLTAHFGYNPPLKRREHGFQCEYALNAHDLPADAMPAYGYIFFQFDQETGDIANIPHICDLLVH